MKVIVRMRWSEESYSWHLDDVFESLEAAQRMPNKSFGPPYGSDFDYIECEVLS